MALTKKENEFKEKILQYIDQSTGSSDSDEEIVNLYVETYTFYQKMRKELKKSPLLMAYTNKLGATNDVKNPLAAEITKTVQILNNLLKSMGLTPAQRKTISPTGGDEFEDFD